MSDLKLQYLDEIIIIVKNQSELLQANYSLSSAAIRLYLNIKFKIDISSADLNLLLEKLVKDGHLAMLNNNAAIYTLTYKGAFFEGYVKQKELNDLNIKSLETDVEIRKMNEIRIVRGTWGLVIATLGLILWEMIKYFHYEHHPF